ncbi:hypothetical protein QR680_007183 [Steinernema hermaphroditum]|uniref:7TM GPCR serpentine receptor class x (Srx) domain-containing protein n=1 Tax=Steinernema hermaphroditum TaxID=289476 RepID=A0AA39LYE0_9BILA|nr:hypothetical protein QR680_007183 [Steinernema hermaphroditum]
MLQMRDKDMPTQEDVVAALVIMVLGLIGVVINSYVLYAVYKSNTFGCAFGRICMSHTVANIGITGVFSLLVAPITLIAPSFHDSYWGHRCGQILIMFWNAAVFSHFLIAINRFICLTWPLDYEIIFRKKITNIALIVAWALAFAQVFAYFWEPCTFAFSFESYSFKFSNGTCGFLIGTIFDYYMSIVIICIIALTDFGTYLKIRRYKKKITTSNVTNAAYLRKKDRKFFYQALAQGVAFGGELISFFTISQIVKGNLWLEFGFTTVAWILVHTIDGPASKINITSSAVAINTEKYGKYVYSAKSAPKKIKLEKPKDFDFVIVETECFSELNDKEVELEWNPEGLEQTVTYIASKEGGQAQNATQKIYTLCLIEGVQAEYYAFEEDGGKREVFVKDADRIYKVNTKFYYVVTVAYKKNSLKNCKGEWYYYKDFEVKKDDSCLKSFGKDAQVDIKKLDKNCYLETFDKSFVLSSGESDSSEQSVTYKSQISRVGNIEGSAAQSDDWGTDHNDHNEYYDVRIHHNKSIYDHQSFYHQDSDEKRHEYHNDYNHRGDHNSSDDNGIDHNVFYDYRDNIDYNGKHNDHGADDHNDFYDY